MCRLITNSATSQLSLNINHHLLPTEFTLCFLLPFVLQAVTQIADFILLVIQHILQCWVTSTVIALSLQIS